MISCGSLIVCCDSPVRLDNYKGCSHGCKYCFANTKRSIDDIKPMNSIKGLKSFIEGKRSKLTNWCDWDIPLHWGGDSDPFQPCEKIFGLSYKILEVFKETKYPFIVSTKGKIIAEDKYLDLLKDCNAVVQISMVSPQFDKLEPGAPTYEERMEMLKKLAPNCRRLIVRHQPYVREAKDEIIKNLPRLKEAGVYGIILEGIKYYKKKSGFIKIGRTYMYPEDVLRYDFAQIKEEAHKNGLVFLSGEERTRDMGDSLTCCCGELEGFKFNMANIYHMDENGNIPYTDKMKEKGTASVFRALKQGTIHNRFCDSPETSYEQAFEIFLDNDFADI